jgi:hypothetical protein
VRNQPHLLRALREFERHCNGHRPHRTLHQAAPLRPLPDPITEPDELRNSWDRCCCHPTSFRGYARGRRSLAACSVRRTQGTRTSGSLPCRCSPRHRGRHMHPWHGILCPSDDVLGRHPSQVSPADTPRHPARSVWLRRSSGPSSTANRSARSLVLAPRSGTPPVSQSRRRPSSRMCHACSRTSSDREPRPTSDHAATGLDLGIDALCNRARTDRDVRRATLR